MQEIDYEPATFWRYFSTRLTDLFCAVLLFFVLFPACVSIAPKLPSYTTSQNYITKVQGESHLYVGDNLIKLSSYLDELDLILKDKCNKFDEEITYFYKNYLPSFDVTIDRFDVAKKEAKYNNQAMFDEKGNRALTNIDYDEAYYSFYSNFYENKAISDLTHVPDYAYCRRVMIITRVSTYLVNGVICYTIFFLVIPLCLYKGKRSVGMLLNGLVLVDDTGFSVDAYRYIRRFFFEFFIIFLGSILALLIPLITTLTFMLVRQNRQSLTDYVCATYMVKKVDSNYLTRKDYIKAKNS